MNGAPMNSSKISHVVFVSGVLALTLIIMSCVTGPLSVVFPKDTIVIEAENFDQTATQIFVVDDAEASGGKAADVPAMTKAMYTIDIPQSGAWYVWVRMYAKNPSSDSCWIGAEEGTPSPFDNAKPEGALRFYADPGDSSRNENAQQVWYWDSGKGNKDEHSVITFSKNGKTVIFLKGRETGTLVDTILLTQDASFNPEKLLAGGPANAAKPATAASTPAPEKLTVAPGTEFFLWKTDAPVFNAGVLAEKERVDIKDPSFCAFIPSDCNGTSVLIIPGGGYQKLVFGIEGIAVAKWLNDRKIAAFVLSYRLPPSHSVIAPSVDDAQRAIRMIRANALSWGLRPDRIGMIGFSAGGHLASVTAIDFPETRLPAQDNIDKQSSRPDFLALIYPSIRPQLPVDERVPPTFIAVSRTDPNVSVEQITNLFQLYQNAKAPVELHVFNTGAHGFGVNATDVNIDEWKTLFIGWLKDIRMTGR